MRTRTTSTLAAAAALAVASSAFAAPGDIRFTIDPTQSSVFATLELALAGSDSDASSVSGFVDVNTDCGAPFPGAVTLIDFDITADQTVNFQLGNPLGGGVFDASIADTRVFFAGAAPIGPIMPDGGGSAVFENVPADQTGTGSYNATGLFCAVLQSQTVPLPCVDSFGLDEEGVIVVEFVNTSIVETSPGDYELTGDLTVRRELDPDNPGLGSFEFFATVLATGTVEPCSCTGDTNGDNQVNTVDLLTLLANFGNATGNGPADGDFDNSGAVTTTDLLTLLSAFGTAC